MRPYDYDAVVVGAGPNGLAAAITLAQAGCSVLLLEANRSVGGCCRSAEITLPGFIHDLGSAIHPLTIASPFFSELALESYGLSWIQPPVPLAHPFDDGSAVALHRSIQQTVAGLGDDGAAYSSLIRPIAAKTGPLLSEVLRPMLHWPRRPFLLSRFGVRALGSVKGLAGRFRHEPARALIAGLGAHSLLPLDTAGSAGPALVLGALGHSVGWPMPKGGTQRIASALSQYFRRLAGTIQTGTRIDSLDQLPSSRVAILDVTPRQFLRIARNRLPDGYARRLEQFRYGPGIFKIDYALSEPIPWSAAVCAQAGTVHVGGSFEEIARAEAEIGEGHHPVRPFLLVAQPSLFDPTRVPVQRHSAWVYTHVPNGSSFNMCERIERQLERFAPGFKGRVLARRLSGPTELETRNANLIGGDISGGLMTVGQMFARPLSAWSPYRTAIRGLFLCSASTPPGPGVHGMCGYHAARAALRFMRLHPKRSWRPISD